MKQELNHSKVLIVEDDFIGRTTLVQIFRKNGFTSIEEAENGKIGLEKLKKHKPDLVVTDMQMPEMDGFEFCRLVRSDSDISISNVPILVQTALSESNEKTKNFNAGASDYINKPVDPQEMIARVKVHLEREMMTRALRDFNTRVSQELETAKSTQRILIPGADSIKEVELRYHLRIRQCMEACSELGGDFWSMKQLSAHELAIFTVDFSGHGVNAALNLFRLHTLIHSMHAGANDPGAYLTHLNAILNPLLPTGQFTTMFYGVINTTSDTLSFASASSPSPILLRQGGYELLDTSGRLLGASENAVYETRNIAFNTGDCLLLYSDALTETPDAAGNMMTAEEAAALFRSGFGGSTPCDRAYETLVSHFHRHHASHLNDDLTLVAMSRA